MSRPEDKRSSEPDNRADGLIADLVVLVRVAWRFSPQTVALQAVLLLLAGLVGGVSLLLLIPIVNSVAAAGMDTSLPIPGVDAVNLSAVPLPALLAAFVALVAISAFITWWSSVNATALQQTIVDNLRQDAFEAILGADWEFALQKRRSDIIELVTTGAARSGIAFLFLLRLLVSTVLFVATAVVALVVAPAVASLSILGVLVLGAVQGSAVLASHRLGRQFGHRNRRLQAVMTDSMASLRLVRAHSAGAVWAKRLGEAFSDTRATQIAQTRRTATIAAFSAVGLATAAAVLVYVATLMDTTPTAIVVILLLVARMARQMQSMTSNAVTLANALPAVRDLTELTASARAAAEVSLTQSTSTGRLELSTTATGPLVQLRDVTYTYPASTNGVYDITLEVPRGQITAITGHSGSGKSTTADILLGLLTPQSGAVVIDDQPLRPEDLEWWRAHVAYVPQETVLIPGSLRENLLWSSDAASDDACWHALDRAAASFAHSLPDGLDTILGDYGVRLSGGERQRVAIARALVREPTLLIMDESTSSLDEVTESRVLELLRTLTPSVTVLVIAHRRSTIDLADHVIRFDNGRIIS